MTETDRGTDDATSTGTGPGGPDGPTPDATDGPPAAPDAADAEDGLVPRRWLLRAGPLALAGGGAVALATVGSEPALAATFERESVAVTTHDGRVTDVTITPEVTMSWDGAEGAVETCAMAIRATRDGSTSTICETEREVHDADGSMTATDLGTHSIVEEGPYERADFRARRDGETTRTTVRLTMECAIRNGDGEPIATTTAHPTIVVTVTNEEVTVTVTGSMNPAVETDEDG